jgi:hypothetical protein
VLGARVSAPRPILSRQMAYCPIRWCLKIARITQARPRKLANRITTRSRRTEILSKSSIALIMKRTTLRFVLGFFTDGLLKFHLHPCRLAPSLSRRNRGILDCAGRRDSDQCNSSGPNCFGNLPLRIILGFGLRTGFGNLLKTKFRNYSELRVS